jgi:hypothetical protein
VCLEGGSEHDALLLGRKGHVHPNVVPMSATIVVVTMRGDDGDDDVDDSEGA